MKPGRARLFIALLLGLTAFALYSRSLWSGFVYDAEAQIQHDSWIHTPSHLADVLTLRVLAQDVLDGTRPVHLLSLMADSLVWGRSPFGYHLTSNLLHALNATLVFLLLTRLAGEPSPRVWLAAAAATLIFVAHPILVEPVAEVSYREDLLALFFTLAGVLLATHFPRPTRKGSIVCGLACVGLLILAAGAKETGFVSPILLAIYALGFRRAEPRLPWLLLVGFAFAGVGIFAAARFGLQPEVSNIFVHRPGYIGGSLAQVFAIQPRIWTFLLANTAWPVRLSADYMPQNIAEITLPWALAALGIVVAIQAVLSWKSRLALFGSALFWLGLAPVSNFLPLFRPIADRFLYMPMAGAAAILCGALLLVRSDRALKFATLPVFAASLALGTASWQRQAVFASPLALWRDTVSKTPFSFTAANNLGYALLQAGDSAGALDSFARTLALTNRSHPDAWAGLALVFDRTGREEQAHNALRRAIALDPRYGRPRKLVEAVVMDEATARALEKILSQLPTSP